MIIEETQKLTGQPYASGATALLTTSFTASDNPLPSTTLATTQIYIMPMQ